MATVPTTTRSTWSRRGSFTSLPNPKPQSSSANKSNPSSLCLSVSVVKKRTTETLRHPEETLNGTWIAQLEAVDPQAKLIIERHDLRFAIGEASRLTQ